jgi:hypothetical protein
MTKRKANRVTKKVTKVRYTKAEDEAIYKHMVSRPRWMTQAQRYKSCLKLDAVHWGRTEASIRTRWAGLRSINPPPPLPPPTPQPIKSTEGPATMELPSKESPKSMTIKVRDIEITVLFTDK